MLIPIDTRLQALDGWRGISILSVLSAHLLPLGPKALSINSTAAAIGMALFFSLSGFLITNFFIKHDSVVDFLIRRFFRIIPLAWIGLVFVLITEQASVITWFANIFFYANWPPMHLTDAGAHFWSLCVEVQFYASIALIVSILGKRGLFIIPLICIAFTAYRISNEVHIAINTYFRIDEILSGSLLALIYNEKLGGKLKHFLGQLNQPALIVLLIISCHPDSGFVNYLRPYFAAMLVGATLVNNSSVLAQALNNKVLFYIATISYALYVFHPLLAHSWLGEGDTLVKYSKRPFLFLMLFTLAHISTFYYEQKWILIGKRLSKQLQNGRRE